MDAILAGVVVVVQIGWVVWRVEGEVEVEADGVKSTRRRLMMVPVFLIDTTQMGIELKTRTPLLVVCGSKHKPAKPGVSSRGRKGRHGREVGRCKKQADRAGAGAGAGAERPFPLTVSCYRLSPFVNLER